MASIEQLQSKAINSYLDALQEFRHQYTDGLITFSEMVNAVATKTHEVSPLADAMHKADTLRQEIGITAKCYLGPDES